MTLNIRKICFSAAFWSWYIDCNYHGMCNFKQNVAMSNTSPVNCPKCDHQFDVQDALTQRLQQQMQQELSEEKQKMMAEHARHENQLRAYQEKLEKEKCQMDRTIRQRLKEQEDVFRRELREEAQKDVAQEVAYLNEVLRKKTEEAAEARELQLEIKKLQHREEEQRRELELHYQERMLTEKRALESSITEQMQKQSALKLQEKELQMRALEKQVGEMKRRIEQGSVQLQGEAQEIAMEERLRQLFPMDGIMDVPKGRNGADIVQVVCNQSMKEAGKIVYESKRTKAFNNDWIAKLKEDQLREGASAAVLVTEVMPADADRVECINGVWVTDFHCYPAVAKLLRDGILLVDRATDAQQNKGSKMEMLYQFLTGTEFKMQIEAIVEGFIGLKEGMTREQLMMKKVWKEREKLIDKVLVNTAEMYGSVQGIAGKALPDMDLLKLSPQEEGKDEEAGRDE